MMAHAGALNVAAASVKGARQVSLEQVLEWNAAATFSAPACAIISPVYLPAP